MSRLPGELEGSVPPLSHSDFVRLCRRPESDLDRWRVEPAHFLDAEALTEVLQACRSGGLQVLGLRQRNMKPSDFDNFSTRMKAQGMGRLPEFGLQLADAPLRQNPKDGRMLVGAEVAIDAFEGLKFTPGFFSPITSREQGGVKYQFSDGINSRDIGTLSPWTLWRQVFER